MNELEDELYERFNFVVDPGQRLLRIDKFLVDKMPNTSRNKIQDATKVGAVKVNNTSVKSNYKVKPSDIITVFLPSPPHNEEIIAENIPLNIVFEDQHLLIVNKSAGMVVHPAYSNWTGTLVNALVYHFETLPEMKGNVGRPGLVHRIDKDTSGLLVIAKSELAMAGLAKQFAEHSIERTYYALVWGEPKEDKGVIKNYIGRNKKDRKVMDVLSENEGKYAVTHFEVLERFKYVSLVKCNLETGRTHQIRIHMKSIGHPLFNDSAYGGDRILKGEQFTKYKQFINNCFQTIPRQALHAKTLGFVHPISHEFVQFNSELPDDFENVLLKWKNYIQ